MPDFPVSAEVVVVGGGVMGASTAYHLAQAGVRRVVLLEREPFFGQGATGRCAGGIRHQFGTAVNIQLSLHSLRMLDALEAETGRSALVRKCGYLFVLTRAADLAEFQAHVALQRSLGVPTEWLNADEVRRLARPAEFPDALAGTFCAWDGQADPYSVVMAYVEAARRLGAHCLSGVSVNGVETAGGRITAVQTSAGRLATAAVVNAAGPWSAAVGRMAGVPVPVVALRRQWLTTTPLPQLPAEFPFVIDFAQSLYFHREGEGLLTGMSNPAELPGEDQSIDPEWELGHLEAAARRLPLLEQAGVTARVAGLYETTPDAHPILGATPLPGFYLLTGFSGHGFMHGPIGGRLLAEIITTGQAQTLDVGALAYSRFAAGALTPEYHVI
ncbi:MAG: FAD-binding oxidoreductase [Anaerolineales bacterium]|nr:FAD-binding oxidoreductase [Anaerolineales bacterium]